MYNTCTYYVHYIQGLKFFKIFCSRGLIMSLSDFSKLEPEKGWIGWGFDLLVQKPLTWGFSTLQGLMKWARKEEHFVVISVVKVCR